MIECTCPAEKMPFGRCCKATTSADVIAGLEMALAQAAAMIERQQHVMQRAMDAWDCTTHQKNGDGRLWQCMEELRGECGKQPNVFYPDPEVSAAEREACAKLCEEVGFAVHGPGREDSEAYDCADAIRARGGEK